MSRRGKCVPERGVGAQVKERDVLRYVHVREFGLQRLQHRVLLREREGEQTRNREEYSRKSGWRQDLAVDGFVDPLEDVAGGEVRQRPGREQRQNDDHTEPLLLSDRRS